jgi:peptidoglycan/xylan/chitin deacetylase (PgdA/CDA1 family)
MDIQKKIGNKFKRKFSYLWRNIAAVFGMNKKMYLHARGARIIAYHGVCLADHRKFNTLFITKKIFEKHLRFYKKYFNVISLADFYNGNFSNDRFNICLSFDDGFANNFKYVLPLLEKYQVPATFFITAIRQVGHDILWNDLLTLASVEAPAEIIFDDEIYRKYNGKTFVSALTKRTLSENLRNTGFAAKEKLAEILLPYSSFKRKRSLEDYWLQMTESEIKELSKSPLATIGSHGYYHNDLAKLPAKQLTEELEKSKDFLASLIHKPVTALAFPYGSYSPAVINAARDAGYNELLATHLLYNNDNAQDVLKERIGINPFISVSNQMFAIIKGNCE